MSVCELAPDGDEHRWIRALPRCINCGVRRNLRKNLNIDHEECPQGKVTLVDSGHSLYGKETRGKHEWKFPSEGVTECFHCGELDESKTKLGPYGDHPADGH
jgi:hypothetical protein